MSRTISHLVWAGTTGIDLGAYTPFLWMFEQRERIYNLQESWTGARLTTSVARVGGMMADVPEGWEAGLRRRCAHLSRYAAGSGHDEHAQRHSAARGRHRGARRCHECRGRDQLFALRADVARERRGLRCPEGPPVHRATRSSTLDIHGYDPSTATSMTGIPGAPRGDGAIGADHGAGTRQTEAGTDQRCRSASFIAAEVTGDERHGGNDLPLQAGDGRNQAACRRGVSRRREPRRASSAPTSCPMESPLQAGAVAHSSAIVPSTSPRCLGLCDGAPALRIS